MPSTARAFKFYGGQIAFDHFLHKRFKRNLMVPSKLGSRFCRIAKQHVDFRRSEVTRVYFDKSATVTHIHPLFVQTGTAPFNPLPQRMQMPPQQIPAPNALHRLLEHNHLELVVAELTTFLPHNRARDPNHAERPNYQEKLDLKALVRLQLRHA
jgi:hypothetical protein